MKPEENPDWSYCKWCRKPFKRTHNRMKYCSEECKTNALREQKAKYQAKRRLLAKKGVLVLPEYKKYGLGSYGTSASAHRKSDFTKEYESIQRDMENIGLKKKRRKEERYGNL